MKILDTVPQGKSDAVQWGRQEVIHEGVKVALCTQAPIQPALRQSTSYRVSGTSPLSHLCDIVQYIYVVIEQ